MRILFTADWHIKLSQKGIPTDWAIKRYRQLFKTIDTVCETNNVDIHIIGGDIFDRVPTLEELALFYEFVTSTKTPVIMYDGNHEATKKGETFFKLLAPTITLLNPNFYVCTKMERLTRNHVSFDILPYCDLRKYITSSVPYKPTQVLFTHVRGNIPPHVHSEVPLEVFQDWEVVIAGDLHSHSNSQENIVYPGSPLTTSFHRNLVQCGGLVIDIEPAGVSHAFVDFELPQLIRKTISDPADAVPTDYHLTLYELEGSIDDLAKVEDNALIDKKLSKRQSEASLILTPDMTIEQEIFEYLHYILNIPEEKTKHLLTVFHDSTKDIKVE